MFVVTSEFMINCDEWIPYCIVGTFNTKEEATAYSMDPAVSANFIKDIRRNNPDIMESDEVELWLEVAGLFKKEEYL